MGSPRRRQQRARRGQGQQRGENQEPGGRPRIQERGFASGLAPRLPASLGGRRTRGWLDRFNHGLVLRQRALVLMSVLLGLLLGMGGSTLSSGLERLMG